MDSLIPGFPPGADYLITRHGRRVGLVDRGWGAGRSSLSSRALGVADTAPAPR
ncbi:MAG: hypothetical protein OXH15_07700 [Gammaproteobacteria bacterium]|nr:hypothetical protein [Gammaproteobacteria bacterium]